MSHCQGRAPVVFWGETPGGSIISQQQHQQQHDRKILDTLSILFHSISSFHPTVSLKGRHRANHDHQHAPGNRARRPHPAPATHPTSSPLLRAPAHPTPREKEHEKKSKTNPRPDTNGFRITNHLILPTIAHTHTYDTHLYYIFNIRYGTSMRAGKKRAGKQGRGTTLKK